MGDLKLTGSEFKVLNLLARHERRGMSEIGIQLGLSSSYTSQIVTSLKEKKFIAVERRGRIKVASLSDAKHASLLRRLMLEYEHIDFGQLLSGASLEVLSAICCLQLKNRNEIMERTLVSEASIAHVLKKLRQIGLIQRRDKIYSVSPRFQSVKDFVMEFRHLLNRNIALQFSSDSLMVWECNHELIVESDELRDREGFLLTGASTFSRFGVQLFVSKWYYLYSPFSKEVKMEDAILHSLLVNADTNLLPTLLIWKKNDRKIDTAYLKKEGRKYGIEDYVDDIIGYFETDGGQRGASFPTWREFLDKAGEYGIS